MENKYKTAYHITKKSNLWNIQKEGLEPKIGRRSNSVDEYKKLLCFTTSLRAIAIWKDRLYKNSSFDDLAVLSFDLEGIEYIQRYDSAGDFFTESKIPPDKVRLVQLVEKSNTQNKVSLENLKDCLIDEQESQYQILENTLTELEVEPETFNKEKVIDELAEYEHKKWSECQGRIHWHAKINMDGSLEVAEEDVDAINKYSKLDYKQTDEIYKEEIKRAVLETFYIMQDSGLIRQLGLEDKELIRILEIAEHNRRNNWNEYMLSLCTVQNGKHVIPSQRVKWWENEIRTPYEKLSDELKKYDKIEVYNIFSEIEKYKTLNQKEGHTTPQDTGR